MYKFFSFSSFSCRNFKYRRVSVLPTVIHVQPTPDSSPTRHYNDTNKLTEETQQVFIGTVN